MGETLSIDAPARPIAIHDVRGAGELRLHVREWGNPEGPPIVFVHGWSQSDLCWSCQTAGSLAGEFRLVSFDLRGHGLSEKPLGREHYGDAELWAADLHAVLERLELERAVLVAWSYGGFVVTDYVRAYGESRVAALNLVGGAVLLTTSFDHIGPGFLDNVPDACAPDLATNIAAICRFLSACTARPLGTDDWAAALAWNMAVPPEVRAALLAREIDADDVLAGLSAPVLVSHGRADTMVLPSMAEHVLGICPTAEASWYDGVGHAPHMEAAERFNRELGELARR